MSDEFTRNIKEIRDINKQTLDTNDWCDLLIDRHNNVYIRRFFTYHNLVDNIKTINGKKPDFTDEKNSLILELVKSLVSSNNTLEIKDNSIDGIEKELDIKVNEVLEKERFESYNKLLVIPYQGFNLTPTSLDFTFTFDFNKKLDERYTYKINFYDSDDNFKPLKELTGTFKDLTSNDLSTLILTGDNLPEKSQIISVIFYKDNNEFYNKIHSNPAYTNKTFKYILEQLNNKVNTQDMLNLIDIKVDKATWDNTIPEIINRLNKLEGN